MKLIKQKGFVITDKPFSLQLIMNELLVHAEFIETFMLYEKTLRAL
tara:strand:- start:3624 stop:3761 length:138 start_codon:yes stop_codon:yes gene_type:complete